MTAPDLFSYQAPDTGTPQGYRATDPQTSRDAAARIEPKLSDLQADVLAALKSAGDRGMTDRELERLPWFADRAPSTIRKRRSDLYHWKNADGESAPKVNAKTDAAGNVVTRDGLTVWVAV